MNLISVIIPVYNVEEYLAECVNSIVKQSYKNIEIILIDDGATDKSGQICDELSKRDQRIKVYHRKNEGVSATRNFGLDIASGEWIFFIDSDTFTAIAVNPFLFSEKGLHLFLLQSGQL